MGFIQTQLGASGSEARDIGVNGFEKVIGKICDENTNLQDTNLQEIADVVYKMSNAIQIGGSAPANGNVVQFWLDTEPTE